MPIARILKQWWLRLAVWGLAGLAVGWLVSSFLPAQYTSEARLRVVQSAISQGFLPNATVDIESLLDGERPVVLSRNVLTMVINNFDLYSKDRKRIPMEYVADEFRKSIRLERLEANVIRISFTYNDPILANKITQDLAARLIQASASQRSTTAREAVHFFQDQVDAMGKSWSELSAKVRATPPSDPRYELLVLNRDQQRKDYEAIAQRLASARIIKDLADRGEDMKLEVLDAASLPDRPDTGPFVPLLVGLGCGLAAGLLLSLLRARRTLDMAAPVMPEPA